MNKFKIAAFQMDIAWENRELNYDKVRKIVAEAKRENADMLILPEMFATGFSMDTSITAENSSGKTPTFLKELALENQIAIVGGYVQKRRDGKGANTALIIDKEGKQLAEYAKTHLFKFAGEDNAHEAGAGPRPFIFKGIEGACFICYDLRFPELFRLVACDSKFVIVIASWPKPRRHHWDALLKARAIENQLYIIGVNRVGEGGAFEYDGGTVVYDPQGNAIADIKNIEGLVFAEIEEEKVTKTRKELPFLSDRRF